MTQEPYHLLRAERAITSPDELLEIIAGQKHMTLALCRGGEPYLVTVNYGYDPRERCFYFHCAPQGKKVDYLRANPTVWGQVLDDRGYLAGRCDHAYRTVQFCGRAELVEDIEDKRRALAMMIERLEPDPEPVKRRFLSEKRVRQVGIVRVRVLEMSGKRSSS
jgi:nitroimidazol reductase NimA-like FMN-containing flavoprotein (pyridoxamine 5'-phosphate oxidase superfamily)